MDLVSHPGTSNFQDEEGRRAGENKLILYLLFRAKPKIDRFHRSPEAAIFIDWRHQILITPDQVLSYRGILVHRDTSVPK